MFVVTTFELIPLDCGVFSSIFKLQLVETQAYKRVICLDNGMRSANRSHRVDAVLMDSHRYSALTQSEVVCITSSKSYFFTNQLQDLSHPMATTGFEQRAISAGLWGVTSFMTWNHPKSGIYGCAFPQSYCEFHRF